MLIAINCRSFLKKQLTGIGRYSLNLARSLAEVDGENEYWLYARKNLFDFKRRVPGRLAPHFRIKMDYWNRAEDRVLKGADVYHLPCLDFFFFFFGPVIVTVHYLIHRTYPDGHALETRELIERQLESAVKKATHFICCSQSTADDLQKFYSVPSQKITKVYQGVDKNIFYPLSEDEKKEAAEALRQLGIEGPFILFVGTIEPRKNVHNLIRAFALLREQGIFRGKLVVVGMKGWMVENLAKDLTQLNIKGQVVFPGYVADEALRFLYNLTELFVYPSFYEGFGFPILEAFSCGAAVVTSNVSSCAEIAGEAAWLVDPAEPSAITAAMAQGLSDPALRLKFKARALERSADFSFRKTAEATLAVYRQVYQGNLTTRTL